MGRIELNGFNVYDEGIVQMAPTLSFHHRATLYCCYHRCRRGCRCRHR